MTKNKKFIQEFCTILGGDSFLLDDRVDQDKLFEMQDAIAELIAKNANKGLSIAKYMVEMFPESFDGAE